MRNCPQCGSRLVRQARRRGLFEWSLSLVTVYPFRCQLCAFRYRAFSGRPRVNPVREYERVLVRYPVVVTPAFSSDSPEPLAGTVVDLSIRGCSVLSPAPVQTLTCVGLRIQIPDSREPIKIDLAVVRALGTSVEEHRLGLQFLSVAPEQHHRLRTIVAGRLHARGGFQGSAPLLGF